jgi:hypothetical protein
VEILGQHSLKCGKGDSCIHVDQRIRNPTDRPLWLVFDAHGDFSGYLEYVSLEGPHGASPLVVWVFGGQNYTEALRLLPGADVVVRDISYMQYAHQRRPVRSAFLDTISIASDRSPWPRSEGFVPTVGELDLGGLKFWSSGELVTLHPRARVSIHTVCVQTTEIPP